MLALIDCAIREPVVDCVNDIIRLWNGPVQYHLPALSGLSSLNRLSEAKAIMVLGSDSSVNDRLSWQSSLLGSIKHHLDQAKPMMGICFGHQFFADLCGGKVDFVSKDQTKLKGFRRLKFSQDFGEIKKGESLALAISHREKVIEVPSSFSALAKSELDHDALAHTELPLWSFQAHPEASLYFLNKAEQKISKNERQIVKRDGERVIRSFFQEIAKA